MHLEAQQWLDSMHGSPVGGGGGINEFIPCFPPVGKEPGSEGCNERAEVLNLLRGQKVDLPDLHQLFEGWPAATNVEVDSLRTVVDADLDKYKLRHPYSQSWNKLILFFFSQALCAREKTLKAQG